ncbi:MAG: hypothetical protein L0Z52_07655 [Acidobacteria bacterium]|nr:hypothetical protein [Acidobacteriota bacterium]
MLALAVLLAGFGSCKPEPTGRSKAPPAGGAAQGAAGPIQPSASANRATFDLPRFLSATRPAYLQAVRRARGWLDDLQVDPIELRKKGIKGKKKLVEQLDAYYRLWKVAGDPEKAELLEQIRQVVAVTYEDRYHDMASINAEWFKQDATSYLRAAVLMERLGLDTSRYRDEIKLIHRRLNEHMAQRGPHQQRTFHWYYQYFGLEEPFPLQGALEKGVIARRIDPRTLSASQAYEITHEVYAPYEFGDRLDVDPFSGADKLYLRKSLSLLAARTISAHDPDLLGEIVECMHYLRFSDEPAYGAGVSYLLRSQNQDGSWGNYPAQEKLRGSIVKVDLQLHTTDVVIGTLTAVFDMPMPPVP